MNKIKICCIEKSYKMLDILNYAINTTNLNIEDICPVLYVYLKNRKLI